MNNVIQMSSELTLDDMIAEYEKCKMFEEQAKSERLQAESRIYEAVGADLKPEGTTKFGRLTITTGYTRKWDESKLAELQEKGIPAGLFPFKQSYKEDLKVSRHLENSEPDVWAAIAEALTLSPKKPSFKLSKEG